MASSPKDLSRLYLRTLWVFQAIAAGPIFVVLGILAILNLFGTFDSIYDFVTHLCTAILAAGIIFIVLVQRKLATTPRVLTRNFEIAKSGLATALWMWLLMDAIFGPKQHFNSNDRRARITSAAAAVLLLLILFYPTILYTTLYLRDETEGEQGPSAANDPEQEHLLDS